jgi:plasmid maintenance system antidote protein VapI
LVAKCIGEYLKENGIKQTWLADRLDVPVTTLNGIINGRAEMKADMFISICRILNVPPETFAKGES